MTDIVNKIFKMRKEIIAKMDRMHILLLLSPSEELSKQLEHVEGLFVSMLEVLEDNRDSMDQSIINRLTNDCETVTNLLNDIKEDISKKFKLISLLFLETQKGEILAYFYNMLEELLAKAGSLENLPNYINESTSDEIIQFMGDVLDYANKYASDNEKRLLPLKYLEDHTTKKDFNLKKWSELQKNIKFTLKYINCDNLEETEKIKEKFWPFELYYFIMITLCE